MKFPSLDRKQKKFPHPAQNKNAILLVHLAPSPALTFKATRPLCYHLEVRRYTVAQ